MAILLAGACEHPAASPAPAATTTTQAEVASGPRVIFPDGFVVRVELATTPETRAQGLMYRDRLRPGTGMLFVFPEDGQNPFWMKNTLIPLDIIWIDQRRVVVHVKESVPPCQADPCPSYDPKTIARYVLEVAGGVLREHPLKNGDVLRFEEVNPPVVR